VDYRETVSDDWDGTEVRGELFEEEEELSLYYDIKGVEAVLSLDTKMWPGKSSEGSTYRIRYESLRHHCKLPLQ
jgi:hypothetical protein